MPSSSVEREILKVLRREKGLTSTELAIILGRSYSQVRFVLKRLEWAGKVVGRWVRLELENGGVAWGKVYSLKLNKSERGKTERDA